ncbi:MAG: hypothetical protein LBB16_01060 [Puniceicoccales bacterium]|nr:hypothetical protein [Puniceicoccales bacterium]
MFVKIANGFSYKNFGNVTGFSSRIFLIREEIVNVFFWLFCLQFGKSISNSLPRINERFSARIRTSDGVVINDFEKIQQIAERIQSAAVIKRVSEQESHGKVSYNSRIIRVDNHNTLTGQISKVLKDMYMCICKEEVYSGNNAVFREKFARYLNFLLVWLERTIKLTGENGDRADVKG